MKYKAAQCLVWEEMRYFVIPKDMDPNAIMVGDRKMSNSVLAQVQSWDAAIMVARAVNLVRSGQQ